MQSDEERTLSNLHVLSAISHNDKLMTKDDTFDIYVPTTWRGVVRMWCGERRDHNIERIRHTVRAAIAFATKTLDEVKTIEGTPSSADSTPRLDHMMQWRSQTTLLQHNRMVDALRDCIKGLQNLLTTYRDDAALSSRIQLLQREIEDFLRVIRPEEARTGKDGSVGATMPARWSSAPSAKGSEGSSVEASPSSSAAPMPARCPSPLSIDAAREPSPARESSPAREPAPTSLLSPLPP